jgi:hypothetical protein
VDDKTKQEGLILSEIIWHGQAGHFVCWRRCVWHLCTEVNGYVISTLGEFFPDMHHDNLGEMEPMGLTPNEMYESMVFEVMGHCHCGCGHPTISGSELVTQRYKTPLEARLGHMALIEEYKNKSHQNT